MSRNPDTRFARRAKDDAERHAMHKTKVRFERGRWRAVCSCQWLSPTVDTMAQADREGRLHREVTL